MVFVLAAAAALYLFFSRRPPVLIVTDAAFAALYGESRLRQQQTSTALALFRPVKPVIIADGASPDMVLAAITEANAQPWCVLFPRSHAQSAARFHEEFPETTAALLGGTVPAPELPSPDPNGFFCVYVTDRDTDLYRAGLLAGILAGIRQKPLKPEEDQEENAPVEEANTRKTIVFWQNRSVRDEGRNLFTQGVMEQEPDAAVIFINLGSQMPEAQGISCVVLTGAGAEYMETHPSMPMILFTWLDPAMTSKNVAVTFDDSVWALAAPASRMAVQQQAEGKIPSNPLIFSAKIADNSVFRLLKKSAKKMPQTENNP